MSIIYSVFNSIHLALYCCLAFSIYFRLRHRAEGTYIYIWPNETERSSQNEEHREHIYSINWSQTNEWTIEMNKKNNPTKENAFFCVSMERQSSRIRCFVLPFFLSSFSSKKGKHIRPFPCSFSVTNSSLLSSVLYSSSSSLYVCVCKVFYCILCIEIKK